MSSVSDDTDIDELINDDERFKCLFASSVVVMENRADVDRTQTEVNPVHYCMELDKKLKHFKENFDQQKTREEFLRSQTSDAQTLTSLETHVLEEISIDLMDDIPAAHVKAWKIAPVGGTHLPIPMIENHYLNRYERVFTTMIDLQLEQLVAERSLLGERIDQQRTLVTLEHQARDLQRGFARDPRRIELNVKIVTTLLLTLLRRGTKRELERFLVHRTILDDELTGGMFIRLDRDEPEVQEASMIRPDSVGVELKVIYNLNMAQMNMLIKYLFSSDPQERLEAKIGLLSSSRSEIRNDLVVNPKRVFEHAIREHFLTRREVMSLLFSHYDKITNVRSQRCPSCKTHLGTAKQLSIPHGYCKVTAWLVDHLGCTHEHGLISVPAYMYVSPGIARFAKEAYGLRTKLQTEPLFAKTRHEFIAYTIDEHGHPKKVAHQGVKQVRIDQPATSSSRHQLS